MMLPNLSRLWRKFWFEPQRTEPLALFRILFGLLVVQMAVLHIGSDFLVWYGKDNIISIESIARNWGGARFDVMLLFPHDNFLLSAYFVSFVIAAICLTLGLATRYSAIWVALGLISLHNHMPFNINGGDAFLRLMGILLMASPCGASLSLDHLIRKRKGLPEETLHCPFWQRMIQVQLALAYCSTFCWKACGPQWWDGSAVYYATRLDDFIKIQVPWLLDNYPFLQFCTWSTLVIEGAAWSLIWFKPCRYYVLLAVLVMHLGIDALFNLPLFEWIFIAALVTFVYPDDLVQLLNKAKSLGLDLIRKAFAGYPMPAQ